jgi:cytoplasmic FMR1 interacting protein
MLVEHVLQSPDVGLLETVLMPFDIYNDAADYALRVLKQRFLYDEIEAEVDLCFDQLVFKLSEHIFAYYKSVAARYNNNNNINSFNWSFASSFFPSF